MVTYLFCFDALINIMNSIINIHYTGHLKTFFENKNHRHVRLNKIVPTHIIFFNEMKQEISPQ